jgi:hypothetical protein
MDGDKRIPYLRTEYRRNLQYGGQWKIMKRQNAEETLDRITTAKLRAMRK